MVESEELEWLIAMLYFEPLEPRLAPFGRQFEYLAPVDCLVLDPIHGVLVPSLEVQSFELPVPKFLDAFEVATVVVAVVEQHWPLELTWPAVARSEFQALELVELQPLEPIVELFATQESLWLVPTDEHFGQFVVRFEYQKLQFDHSVSAE